MNFLATRRCRSVLRTQGAISAFCVRRTVRRRRVARKFISLMSCVARKFISLMSCVARKFISLMSCVARKFISLILYWGLISPTVAAGAAEYGNAAPPGASSRFHGLCARCPRSFASERWRVPLADSAFSAAELAPEPSRSLCSGGKHPEKARPPALPATRRPRIGQGPSV